MIFLAAACGTDKVFFVDPFKPADAFERVKLNYKVYGKGDTTLFFVHGWNLNMLCWNKQIPAFVQNMLRDL
jgi:sigma-B regulation protein RsbQ